MKICKNCGRESEENKIRCPFCGYLFEDEMDSVLREMHLNLNLFKEGLKDANQSASSVTGEEVGSVETFMPVQSSREQEELKLEIANLRGQLTAMQGELGRMSMQRSGVVSQSPVVYPGLPAQSGYYAGYPSPVPADGVYSQILEEGNSSAPVYAGMGMGFRRTRSKRRIVLTVILLLLLAASIASLFFPWAKESFTGWDGVKYIFGLGAEGDRFDLYLAMIRSISFADDPSIAKLCSDLCYYVIRYGVIVYAAMLILDFPLLLSLGGRVRLKAWHIVFTWLSLFAGLILFGFFCWESGFSAVTVFFMGGVAANLLRGFFLVFFK